MSAKKDLSRRNVAAMAREHADEAIVTLVKAMRSEDLRVAKDAASALLDRAVGRPAQALIGGDEDDPEIKAIVEIRRTFVRPDP